MFVCVFQPENNYMILDYICYEHHALGAHVNIFRFSFFFFTINNTSIGDALAYEMEGHLRHF